MFADVVDHWYAVTSFGDKRVVVVDIGVGPCPQRQPLGLEVGWHRLMRGHGGNVATSARAIVVDDRSVVRMWVAGTGC